MDFTRPDAPVDGVFHRVLFVRDLASGYVLLAQPCTSECAAVARHALERLFAIHGPPLVLKSDNGSTGMGGGQAQFPTAEIEPDPILAPLQWLVRAWAGRGLARFPGGGVPPAGKGA